VRAVTAFQQRHTNVADGRVDPGGPTITKLEELFDRVGEAQLRSDLLDILAGLDRQLARTGGRLPPEVQAQLAALADRVRMLAVGSPGSDRAGFAGDPTFRPAYLRGVDHPRVVLAAAALAPAAGAAVAVEAMILALMALIAMLILIQLMPHISEAVEDLLRQIQILVASLVDTINEAVEGVEDLIRRNARAGMRCSAEILAFRELTRRLLDALKSPRPADELGRKRWVKQTTDLAQEWREALATVLACMAANGAT
jgi:hypothetical protein